MPSNQGDEVISEIPLKLEDVSLNEISSEIINRYKSICDDKSIRVSLEGEAVIRADRLLLERVIDNFFINAIDNMHEGGAVSIAINEIYLKYITAAATYRKILSMIFGFSIKRLTRDAIVQREQVLVFQLPAKF